MAVLRIGAYQPCRPLLGIFRRRRHAYSPEVECGGVGGGDMYTIHRCPRCGWTCGLVGDSAKPQQIAMIEGRIQARRNGVVPSPAPQAKGNEVAA